MHYGGPKEGWRCGSGQVADTGGMGSLWLAVQALLGGLHAGGAMLTWLDRGLPSVGEASGRESSGGSAFGWLGGLEANEQAQRPEL